MALEIPLSSEDGGSPHFLVTCWGPKIINWHRICLRPSLPCLVGQFGSLEIQLPLCQLGSQSKTKSAEDSAGKINTHVWGWILTCLWCYCLFNHHYAVPGKASTLSLQARDPGSLFSENTHPPRALFAHNSFFFHNKYIINSFIVYINYKIKF